MSAYWYAVNDAAKTHVFVVGQNHRPDEDHVDLYLRDNGIHWTGAFRLVSDEEDELWGMIDKTYREVKAAKPMLVRERYGFWSCPDCGRIDPRAGATWGCPTCQKRVGVR